MDAVFTFFRPYQYSIWIEVPAGFISIKDMGCVDIIEKLFHLISLLFDLLWAQNRFSFEVRVVRREAVMSFEIRNIPGRRMKF
jgi:hypothetical protein